LPHVRGILTCRPVGCRHGWFSVAPAWGRRTVAAPRKEAHADQATARLGTARHGGDARASVPPAPAAPQSHRPGPILLAGTPALRRATRADEPGAQDDPSAALYPVARNERYVLDRPVSDERLVTTYNNFYEFGSHKQIWQAAQSLPSRPWTVTLDGMVEREQVLDIDELLTQMPPDERLYRHRCVEAWSMAVPWSGLPLAALIDLARPLGSARYVRMETFLAPETAPGQRQFCYPWPLDRRGDS
jgi:DMSO/TMAO reductase YedYZ molybdopterin-dependent catalytic subunit